ncbi:hypothetical protein C922_05468 [Plasmodium inui San Antonio 1]|uniref:Uncharacterized protein n=1 Tax=Plasmodium inui San Antonio 1 TaxID=1237626 RepID=W6ZTA1_9APIC|nr:hypothetical protein C922_05468 [Plasmodium inui San Antonio 1]EUD64152.1 hypothetical protein C922_05468 [Plasmodium inui San Antonio 1]
MGQINPTLPSYELIPQSLKSREGRLSNGLNKRSYISKSRRNQEKNQPINLMKKPQNPKLVPPRQMMNSRKKNTTIPKKSYHIR